ncbi:DUF4129 domain-containing protein [Schlesneria paludicola]|uniref:DUF4129 domain-containing protein n=1 Tax=Schlesneria paludicola TaxID=360056 RepID=UPI00029A1612|nr:DUF4129 domain-containing protein [Schlesneria paludicola]
MAKTARRVMTLADYLVIAISPALIMSLIGSLAFFLLEISYSGRYRERMLWVLGWFVFGSVLIARIAIQEGRQHAALFGIGLAAVTGLFAATYADQILIAFILLGVIWWCAGKLTWDCTLIDDSQDASGEGLLQIAQLSERPQDLTETDHQTPLDASQARPHTPGLWVVYFSLTALPLFGVGQLFIPLQDSARRAYGFQLLTVYVTSALGLLLATSFLGLRRYLRQRNLHMPPTMAANWLMGGSLLAGIILLIAMLIPRPQGEYTLTALIDRMDEKLQQASRFALMGNDKGKSPGRPIGKVDPNGRQARTDKPPSSDPSIQKQPNESDPSPTANGDSRSPSQQGETQSSRGPSSKDDSQSTSSKSSPSNQSTSGNGKQNSGERPQDASGPKNQPGPEPTAGMQKPTEQSVTRPSSQPSQPPVAGHRPLLAMIASFFKWMVYGALFLLAAFLVIVYRERILATLARLWDALMSLFQWQSTHNSAPSIDEPPKRPKRLFSSFTNPFVSGAHLQMSPVAIVVYSFDALTAWADQRNLGRAEEQTPLEFAEVLSLRFPDLAESVMPTAKLYAGIAYGNQSPSRETITVLQHLWTSLDRNPEASVSTNRRAKRK